MYVRDLHAVYACDYFCSDPIFGGSDALELEFKTWIDGLNEVKTYWYNVPPNSSYDAPGGWPGLTIRNEIAAPGHSLRIELWEADNGGDDRWIQIYRGAGPFNTTLTAGGNLRCNADGTTRYTEWPCYVFIWHEINANFATR